MGAYLPVSEEELGEAVYFLEYANAAYGWPVHSALHTEVGTSRAWVEPAEPAGRCN